MEEKLNKKKKYSWIKPVLVVIAGVGIGTLIYKGAEKLGDLVKENRRLEGENFDLKGQISANEKENRRLSREIGNLNFQLGKLVAAMKK